MTSPRVARLRVAAQVIPGVRHTRGTPPAVVETDHGTLIDVARGALTWHDAVAAEAQFDAPVAELRDAWSATLPAALA